jgi:hypothetical protein
VWTIYEAFRGRFSLHMAGKIARQLESVGILIRPPQLNRPRQIDIDEAWYFTSPVIGWVPSEPQTEIVEE